MQQKKKILSGLEGKLVAWFLVLTLLPIVAISFLSFYNAKGNLEHVIYNELESVNRLKVKSIIQYFHERQGDLTVLSKSQDIMIVLEKLKAYRETEKIDTNASYPIHTETYQKLHTEIDPFFRVVAETFGYDDIFLICQAHGHVMYTVKKESDLGANLRTGELRNSGLARIWEKIVKEKQFCIEDYNYYTPSQAPALFVGVPIHGALEAVLVVQIHPQQIDQIMQERTGMGKTGESYLVGDDYLLRSNSRFQQNSIMQQKVETIASKSVIEQYKEGTGLIKDYRGTLVLSAYAPVGLKKEFNTDFKWAVISEIDVAEEFTPIYSLRGWILIFSFIAIIVITIVALCVAKSIVKPVQGMAVITQKVAEGDLTLAVTVNTHDEVGEMGGAFNRMITALRTIVSEVFHIAERVSSASQQLSSSAEEMNATTEEISSTVQEIAKGTETQAQKVDQTQKLMDEMSSSVSQVSKSVQSVALQASQTVDTAQKGGNSVAMAQQKIGEVSSVIVDSAAMVKKLGERSEQIGEIVDVITNFADQTNLLALNAAIEAARAGESGRGFAVVAEEVRKLAEGSAKAAYEIGKLIREVQKETAQAVGNMGRVLEGAHEVKDHGQKVSDALGEIIKNIENLATMIQHIAAAAQDQLTGVKQAAGAVTDIASVAEETASATQEASASTQEMTASMQEMAASAQELADMALSLRDMVARFKIGEDMSDKVKKAVKETTNGPSLDSKNSVFTKTHPHINMLAKKHQDKGKKV